MNGVCCRRLLDNVSDIFDEIKKVVSEKLSQDQSKTEWAKQKITLVLDDFYHLFETADIVFSQLRILDPTLEEIENIKNQLGCLKSCGKTSS